MDIGCRVARAKKKCTRPPLTRRVTGAAPAWSRRMEPHCMSPTCGAKDVRRAQSTCESLDRNCVLLRGPVCGVALMGATGSWLLALVVRHAQQKDARYPRFPNTWECPARAPVSNCVRHYAEQPLAHSLTRLRAGGEGWVESASLHLTHHPVGWKPT